MSKFKERKNTAGRSLHDIAQFMRVHTPDIAELRFPTEKIHSTFDLLADVSVMHPQLDFLAGALVRDEAERIITNMPSISAPLQQYIEPLPNIRKAMLSSTLLDSQAMNQFHHDMGTPLQIIYNKVDLLSQQYVDDFTEKYDIFRNLIAKLNSEESLTYLAYSDILRDYTQQVMIPFLIPALTITTSSPLYELHELRSGLRELAHMSPMQFATRFFLKSTLEDFVQNRQFRDKNTGKPVAVHFDTETTNPEVFMDIGDLYRMTRNLLRDAVTHGTGKQITPVIAIESTDGVVYLSVYSPGTLPEETLQVISRQPYTTSDRDWTPHGYGKVGARKLLEDHWRALGKTDQEIAQLMHEHWSNVKYQGNPYVRWKAPIPYAA